ncbi:MAG TPA: sulfite oxidase [Actinomycetota bacterium]|jgi:DMSO/TMAO reductase YedYZ molybdopterin-dependent catalytic subunit|nr:sulfite oxidase [Actinomycetota bacterium]
MTSVADDAGITRQELQLAARNHGMPLEALRYDVTPPGLHYLLIHYDIPQIDADAWRLRVGGLLARPLELSLSDLRQRTTVTRAVTLECAGNGRALLDPRPLSQPWLLEAVGNAEWTGVPLRDVLEEAGVEPGAAELVFTGLDRGVEGEIEQAYERSLSIDESMREDVLLAFAMNGQELPPQHGAPLRLIVPGWYGMTSVKWLSRITAVGEKFGGYQMATSYRFRSDPDEVGEAVTRIRPRSLMIPPGIPEFLTRSRVLDAGTHEVRGRAWSGLGAIERVEFSDDDGGTWVDTRLDAPHRDSTAWRGWSIEWGASPGARVLCCRATDSTGVAQPLEPGWNVGGYANNSVQRVTVTVRG